MMPVYKNFDRALHARHDVQGRETVKNYVKTHKDGIIAQMFVCNAETVLNAPLVEVSNKYVQKGELFYDVKTADLYQTET